MLALAMSILFSLNKQVFTTLSAIITKSRQEAIFLPGFCLLPKNIKTVPKVHKSGIFIIDVTYVTPYLQDILLSLAYNRP